MKNPHSSDVQNGLATDSSGSVIQIVDAEKSFCSSLQDYLRNQKVLAVGYDYHIISVFGSQSTGKSTLLNMLFKTNFGVMGGLARQQTTKGIWLSKSKAQLSDSSKQIAPNILVLDVEGTDGRERGDDKDFERKSALFALAISEVLIINLWEHQVGLYQGANLALLQTVFEVNLQLFGKNGGDRPLSKSLLFFIIRDHIGTIPFSNLQETLTKDVENAWANMSKPDVFKEAKMSDYFDLAFTALPHKPLQEEKFADEVIKLRDRFQIGDPITDSKHYFSDPSSKLLLPAYHRDIPADGFSKYASDIWTAILDNKDLDLPTQHELLAQFRCDEIRTGVVALFEDEVGPIKEEQRNRTRVGRVEVISDLGATLRKARTFALDTFHTDAGRYHKPTFASKFEGLQITLDSQLELMIKDQLDTAHKEGIRVFVDGVTDVVKNHQKFSVSNDFATVVRDKRSEVQTWFEKVGKEMLIPSSDTEYFEWSKYDFHLLMFSKAVDKHSAEMRAEELHHLFDRMETSVRTKINDSVSLKFSILGCRASGFTPKDQQTSDEADFWDRIWSGFTEIVHQAEKNFTTSAKCFGAELKEGQLELWKLRRASWTILKEAINKETTEKSLLSKLRESFEDKFRYDDSGIPRVWQPTDDIEGIFGTARDSTIKLVTLLSKINLNETLEPPPLATWIGSTPNFGEADRVTKKNPISGIDITYDTDNTINDEMTILSDIQMQDAKVQFNRTADGAFTEAKRSAIGGVTQIPLYFYGLLFALGWNEIVAVLSSPLYFAFLLLVGALAYTTYTLNLWGPILRMANAASAQAVEMSKEQLRAFLEAPDSRRPVPIPARSQNDIPLRDLNTSGHRVGADDE